LKIVLLILLFPVHLLGQAVFSEVLYNEPGSRTLEEWVELYNRADSVIDLSNFIFVSGNDTTVFQNATIMPARGYAVLARRLTSSDGTASFESHWGDSSGYWGDGPKENYPAFEVRMDLPNLSGAVYLIKVNGDIIDECAWSNAAADGQSLERNALDPPSNNWHLSTDSLLATPGRANSPFETQSVAEALSLSTRLISQSKGEKLKIDYVAPSGSNMTIEIFDDSGHKQITLLENVSGQGQVSWDGKSDADKKLPPGVYILLSTFSGSRNNAKTVPVVIAP
jgi:hypothetical protein